MEKEKKDLLNQEILSYIFSKNRKYNQVVWIPLPEYLKILETAENLKIAPNQLIAAIVVAFFRNMPLFVKEKEKVVEKLVPQVEKIVYFCALCEQVFENSQDLRIHLIKCRNNFIQKLNKN